jgi:hypothetical protein
MTGESTSPRLLIGTIRIKDEIFSYICVREGTGWATHGEAPPSAESR